MSQIGKTVVAKTVSTRDFLAGLAQNAGTFLSLDVSRLSLGENVDARLRAIHLVSVEDLDWEVWFFRTKDAAGNSADPDVNSALGIATLPTTGLRIAGAGLYHFYLEDVDIPIFDCDRTSKVHMALVNRAAGSKSANAAGAVRLELVLEPALGM